MITSSFKGLLSHWFQFCNKGLCESEKVLKRNTVFAEKAREGRVNKVFTVGKRAKNCMDILG
jgi:hypothetical protein